MQVHVACSCKFRGEDRPFLLKAHIFVFLFILHSAKKSVLKIPVFLFILLNNSKFNIFPKNTLFSWSFFHTDSKFRSFKQKINILNQSSSSGKSFHR